MKNLTIKIKSILLIICGSVLLSSISTAEPTPKFSKEIPKILHGTWIVKSISSDQGKTFKDVNVKIGVINSDSFMPNEGDIAEMVEKIMIMETKESTNIVVLQFYSGTIWVVMVYPKFYPRIVLSVFSNQEDFNKQKEKSRLYVVIKR